MVKPCLGARFECTQCGRLYSTSSHLQRHKATHSSTRQVACTFCNRRFLRSDVLLRHSRTCKQKATQPVPPSRKPGRKRKACDQCAFGRVACDGDSPCESWLFKGLDCSYGRVRRSNDQLGRQQTSHSQQIPVSFLLNYTEPCPKSALDFHRMLGGYSNNVSEAMDATAGCDSMVSYPFTETWLSIFHTFIDVESLEMPSHNAYLLYGLEDSAKLASTIDRLTIHLEQLQEAVSTEEADLPKSELFLSKANIIMFVNAFCNDSNHSNRFIHKDSFNVNTASTQLLLAILLLGATSTSPEDAATAEKFSKRVGYSVFEGPEFQRLLYQENDPAPSRENIQLVQAAMLTIVLRPSTSQLKVERRIRIQRVPTLVSAVRLLDLTQVLNDIVLDGETANLDEYIHRETLVRIMAWVYLLDSHCVIFSNSPPQFRIAEADFGLPRHDMVFKATGLSDLTELISNMDIQGPPLSLRSVVQRLMDDKPTGIEELLPQVDSLFALFLVLSALHCVLFDLQALGSYADIPGVFKPIERALDTWKLLWDLFNTRTQQQGLSQSGFMAHGMEFWWLAKMLVKYPQGLRRRDRFSAGSVDHFHDMVKELRAVDTNFARR